MEVDNNQKIYTQQNYKEIEENTRKLEQVLEVVE